MDDQMRSRIAELLIAGAAGGAQSPGNVGSTLASLPPAYPSRTERRAGMAGLREQMGGEPAFWGPLNRMLFGYPLYGLPEEQVRLMMQGRMGQAQETSDAVPRGWMTGKTGDY